MKRILSPVSLVFVTFAPAAPAQQAAHRSHIPPAERAQVVREAQAVEIRAEREAKEKYGDKKQFFAKQKRMQIALEEKYYFQVCWRHRISHKQMITIMSEGLRSGLQALAQPGKNPANRGKN